MFRVYGKKKLERNRLILPKGVFHQVRKNPNAGFWNTFSTCAPPPIENQQKTIEGILLQVFKTMVAKKTQGTFSTLFVLSRKFSDFVPRVFNALRNFPTFLVLDFPQLLVLQERDLNFISMCNKVFKIPIWLFI